MPAGRTLQLRMVTVAIVSGATLLASGCGGLTPGVSSSDKTPTTAGKKLTADDVKKLGNVTVSMSDFESSGGQNDALKADIAKFQSLYPNVTIKRSSKAFADYGKTIQLSMSSANAPDIAEANVVMARRLIPAGLVVDMGSYYDAYGWKQRYPASVLGLLKAEKTGKVFGTGSFWGQSLGGNMVGVYYNVKLLKSLGLAVPKTYDDFVAAMAAAKAKGLLPLQLGNLEQSPANHVVSTIMNDYENPQTIRDWINGKAGATFGTAGNKEALAAVKDFAKKGYISPQANGTKDDDAAAAFAARKGVFDITGSWRDTQFSDGLGADGGFMLLPPKTAGQNSSATGWLTNPFTISSKSKNADIAAFFLDWMSGPETAATNLRGGYLPFSGDAKAGGGPVAADVLAAWKTAVQKDALVPYLDFATPSMGDTMFPALQALIGGRQSPDQVVAAVQKDWADYHTG